MPYLRVQQVIWTRRPHNSPETDQLGPRLPHQRNHDLQRRLLMMFVPFEWICLVLSVILRCMVCGGGKGVPLVIFLFDV